MVAKGLKWHHTRALFLRAVENGTTEQFHQATQDQEVRANGDARLLRGNDGSRSDTKGQSAPPAIEELPLHLGTEQAIKAVESQTLPASPVRNADPSEWYGGRVGATLEAKGSRFSDGN